MLSNVFITFKGYLSLLNCSGINISFLCFLLIKRSAIFVAAPSLSSLCFFLSLLISLSMFCTLFYCCFPSSAKVNVPGSVHSSNLILFSCFLNSILQEKHQLKKVGINFFHFYRLFSERYIIITSTTLYPVKNI